MKGVNMNGLTQIMEMRFQNQEEKDFLAELRKNPITETELREMMKSGGTNTKHFFGLVTKLRKEGLIVPDVQQSFEEFEELNSSYICIKASTLAQMDREEFREIRLGSDPDREPGFQSSKSKGGHEVRIYRDIAEGSKVVHYSYVENGVIVQTGSGMNVRVQSLRNQQVNDKLPIHLSKLVNEAKAYYKKARKEVDSVLAKARSTEPKGTYDNPYLGA